MAKKKKEKAQAKWKVLGKLRDEARSKRGISHVQPADMDRYQRTMSELKQKLSAPPVPAMPVVAFKQVSAAKATAFASNATAHMDKIGDAYTASEEMFILIHKPISVEKAQKIPTGKLALDKEWNKLWDKPFVSWRSVKSERDVKKLADAWKNKYKRSLYSDLDDEWDSCGTWGFTNCYESSMKRLSKLGFR